MSMSDNPEALPCPFCGEVGVTVHEGSTFRWRYSACDHCGAQTGEVRVNTMSADREKAEQDVRAAAIAEWNTRAALAQQAATPTPAEPERREYDEAVEALRRALCALPRFSFLLDSAGNVRRVPDRSGNWIDFQAAHTLFDPVCVDALLAKTEAEMALAKASQKESDRA